MLTVLSNEEKCIGLTDSIWDFNLGAVACSMGVQPVESNETFTEDLRTVAGQLSPYQLPASQYPHQLPVSTQ